MTDDHDVLFGEQGASWWWLIGGPVAALAMSLIQYRAGTGSPIVPLGFLVVLTAVFTVQVNAARLHTSVELTPVALREGTETILLSEILTVFQEEPKKPKSAEPQESWQTARTLGELPGIPKGRTAIGLKLTKGRTAQAWARDHERLRAELTRLVAERAAS
jgi:hypothetical protein